MKGFSLLMALIFSFTAFAQGRTGENVNGTITSGDSKIRFVCVDSECKIAKFVLERGDGIKHDLTKNLDIYAAESSLQDTRDDGDPQLFYLTEGLLENDGLSFPIFLLAFTPVAVTGAIDLITWPFRSRVFASPYEKAQRKILKSLSRDVKVSLKVFRAIEKYIRNRFAKFEDQILKREQEAAAKVEEQARLLRAEAFRNEHPEIQEGAYRNCYVKSARDTHWTGERTIILGEYNQLYIEGVFSGNYDTKNPDMQTLLAKTLEKHVRNGVCIPRSQEEQRMMDDPKIIYDVAAGDFKNCELKLNIKGWAHQLYIGGKFIGNFDNKTDLVKLQHLLAQKITEGYCYKE